MRSAIGLVLLILVVRAAPAAQPVSFRAPDVYPIQGATQLIAADFNGDGYPDLAVPQNSYSYNTVAILLNNGHGSFRPAVTYTVGAQPSAVAAGDFNGDGKLDLAVANGNNCYELPQPCSSSFSILLGNGDGTFQPAITYSAGSAPVAVAAGDFNHDGKLDLVLVNNGYIAEGTTVSVLIGNGDGSFQPAVDYTAAEGADSVALADFNGDGKLDLAVGTGSGIALLLGNGDGTFQPAALVGVPNVSAVAAGDLNGDGKIDLVACAPDNLRGADTVYVLLGNGNGTFQSPVGYRAEAYPYALTLADLNGDGNLDVAVANAAELYRDATTPGVTVLLGAGDGTLQRGRSYNYFSANEGIAAADFRHDGQMDLAASLADGFYASVMVLRGEGNGRFQDVTSYSMPAYPDSAAVADFDGDGKPDLAIASTETPEVSILLGAGKGSFQKPVNYPAAANPESIATADFNGDGKPDLVMDNDGLDAVSIMLGNGDGTFQSPVTYPVSNNARLLITGDFNGDHHPDVVTIGWLDSTGTISILLGNGDGTLRPATSFSIGTTIHFIAAADFNHDGKLDLAACNEFPSTVSVMLGNGDGTFQPPIATDIGGYCGNFAVADLNGDGKPDLVIQNITLEDSIPYLTVMLGKGNGTFGPGHTLSVLYPGGDIAIADYNGDGNLDIAVTDGESDSMAVLLGKGNGAFDPARYFAGGSPFAFMSTGDFNADGKPDLVIGNEASSGSITVMINTTP